MHCKHKPDDYKKMLLHGDEGMICRYCKKTIRTKNRHKSNIIRKILVIVPIILFCILAAMDISEIPNGKVILLGSFAGCLAVSIIGWLIICRFVLEYEIVPENTAPLSDAENE